MTSQAPPGAQPERTALAWQRTLVGVVGGTLVIAMTALRSGVPVLAAAATALALYVAVALLSGPPGRNPAADHRNGRAVRTGTVLVRVVGVVAILGALGACLAVVATLRAL